MIRFWLSGPAGHAAQDRLPRALKARRREARSNESSEPPLGPDARARASAQPSPASGRAGLPAAAGATVAARADDPALRANRLGTSALSAVTWSAARALAAPALCRACTVFQGWCAGVPAAVRLASWCCRGHVRWRSGVQAG
jgi:hypothetical protein